MSVKPIELNDSSNDLPRVLEHYEKLIKYNSKEISALKKVCFG